MKRCSSEEDIYSLLGNQYKGRDAAGGSAGDMWTHLGVERGQFGACLLRVCYMAKPALAGAEFPLPAAFLA